MPQYFDDEEGTVAESLLSWFRKFYSLWTCTKYHSNSMLICLDVQDITTRLVVYVPGTVAVVSDVILTKTKKVWSCYMHKHCAQTDLWALLTRYSLLASLKGLAWALY